MTCLQLAIRGLVNSCMHFTDILCRCRISEANESKMDNSDKNVHFSVRTEFLIPTVLLALVFVIGSVIYFVSKLNKSKGDRRGVRDVDAARQRNDDAPVVRVPERRARGARQRMVRQAVRQEELEEDDVDQVQEEFDYESGKTKKMGAKKARKLEMKAEKQAQREQELAEREERKRRQEMVDLKRQQEINKEEQDQKQKEEEEARLKEERERQEEEAYLLLKGSFEVHEEGFEQVLTETESQNLLQEFVNYIKVKKVVLLEDLGAQFNMKTQEAIQRVQELQDQGLLTGVVDDRGKFIFISQDELEGVAKFMRQRGRVSISDLAEASNTLVFLNTENDSTLQQALVA